jgi:type I restriction enzyme, S subunit
MTWPLVPIGSFCETGSGTTPPRSQLDRYYGGAIPWVKSGELRESVITSTEETVSQSALEDTPLRLVPPGSILVAMYGATVGRVGILGIAATTNQAVCSIVPDPKIVESRYLFHALQYKLPEFISRSVGGAQPNISQQIIRNTQVALPPLDEQCRIAAILDAADALRAKRRATLAKLDTLAQSIFIEMFGDPILNPFQFPVDRLEEVLSQPLQNGAYFPQGSYSENGIEMVHMSDAFYRVIVRGNLRRVLCEPDIAKKYSLLDTDIIVARRSLNYEGAAKPCRIPKSELPLIFESSFIRVSPNLQKISTAYLFHYLENNRVRREYVRPFVTQSTISGINQTNLARLPVIRPPIELQQEFSATETSIEVQRLILDQDLKLFDALFASVQHRAFRGEL